MEYSLSEQQKAFRHRFERFCQERIAPRAREADRRGTLPLETWKDLREVGYLRLFHPPELGGTGADTVTCALAIESLAQACGSTAWTASISSVLCGKILYELGTPEHQQRWLRPIIEGEILGAYGLVERGSGSDPGSYRTVLRKSGRGWRLSGEKARVSNGPVARVAAVVARIEDARPGEGLAYAFVDLERPGVHRTSVELLGLRAMPWGTLTFDEVEIAEEDIIREVPMDRTLRAVEWGQLLQSCSSLGFAEAALEICLRFVRQREAFGRPLAHLQAVHSRLAEMRVEVEATRLLCHDAARLKSQGLPARELMMMAKVSATEMAVRVCDHAMRLLAAWGYTTECELERVYRDSLGNVAGGLATDRLRELIACGMVGTSPWEYEPFDWLSTSGLKP